MAATTTLLGLVTPTQGTLSGTWGDTVNYGISDYVDISVAGTLTLTNDGAVTLANTTGSSAGSNITSSLTGAGTVTAQFAIVKVTGTLTVAKVVTGPSYSKTYTVVNAATGGIVTFKASGQTGVSVAVGESAFVYFNGTDYVKIVGTATAGAAGGSTTQVQYNNAGVLAGITGATTNGTALTLVAPNLGSPASVGTMPAFTLGGTVSGGGNQINNVIIGTSTPLAGTFTQLDITAQGTLRLQDTTGGEYVALRAPSSLAGNYTLTFPADDGTSGQALITDGSGVLSWSTAASGDVYGPGSSTDNAVARFDSTTGKLLQNSVVLIGDTGAVTGVTDLTASGTVTLSGGTANGVTYLNGSKVLTSGSALTFDGTTLTTTILSSSALSVSNNASAINLTNASYGQIVSTNTLIIDTTAGDMAFRPSATEGMRLTSTGLGIGTSSPAVKLETAGLSNGATLELLRINNTGSGASTAGQIVFRAAGSNYADIIGGYGTVSARLSFNVAAGGYQSFAIGGSDKLTLDGSGNLGLGVTPSAWGSEYKVVQNGTTSFYNASNYGYSGLLFNAYNDNTNNRYASTNRAGEYRFDVTTGNHAWFNAASGTSGNAITFTQAMTLDASGNLGVGTTSPADTNNFGRSLDIRSSTGAAAYFRDSDDATKYGLAGFFGADSNAYYGSWGTSTGVLFYSSGTERMRLDSSGRLLVGLTSSQSNNARLQVKRTDATVGATTYSLGWLQNATGNEDGLNILATDNVVTIAADYAGTNHATNLVFATNNSAGAFSATEKMRLTNTGQLLVGLTSGGALGTVSTYAANNAYGLVLQSATYGLRLSSNTTNSAYSIEAVDGTGGVSYQPLYIGSGGSTFATGTAGGGSLTTRMIIADTGRVTINNGEYTVINGSVYAKTPSSTGFSLGFNPSGGAGEAQLVWGTGGAAYPFIISSYNGTTTTQRVELSTTGILALSGSPRAWASNDYKAIQIGSGGSAIYGGEGSGFSPIALVSNAYVSGGSTAYTYSTNSQSAGYYRIQGNVHTWGIAAAGSGAVSFTTAVTLTGDGDLLVGRTAQTANERFNATTTTSTVWSMALNSVNRGWLNRQSDSGGGLAAYFEVGASNTAVGNITTTASATSFVTSSDYRLKNTIAPMTGALAKVALLKPCTYKWNIDGSDGQGFIAHELAEVVPECVTGKKDAVDENGKIKPQGVDTSFLVATLTAAIQEQQAIIESLKARLDAANL